MSNILKGIIKLEVQGGEKITALERQFKAFGGLKPFSRTIVPEIKNLENSLKKLPNTSNQATLALGNLSRVAQDAPYGFMGIANNLNPLLESFQRLKVSTGSTSGALKALGSSLTGAGGIGLALGVVSSLAVVFGDKLFGSSKAAKAAAEANEELAKSITGDLVKLTTLVGVVQNVATSTENRKNALKALNDQYAQYLPNQEKEGITAANIAKSYDLITESLLRQAVVKGIQKEIEEAITKTAAGIIQLQKAEEQKRINSEKVNKATKVQTTAMEDAKRSMDRYSGTIRDGNIAEISHQAELNRSVGLVDTYDAALERLTGRIKRQIEPLLNLTTNFKDLGIALSKPPSEQKDSTSEIIARAKRIYEAYKDIFEWDPLESTCRHASLSIL